MAIFEFTNLEGKVCRIPWPPGTLSEVEMLYRECGASADEEQDMENVLIGPKDTLRFTHGEASGAELSLLAERQEADRVASRFAEDGLGSYSEGYQKYLQAHPGARARLAGVAQSPEDVLRRQGADKGYVVETETGIRYHVSGAPPRAEDQSDPAEDDVVTIVERGVGRYIVHGAIATQDYQKKPALGKVKTGQEARDRLRSLVRGKITQGREDALLDILRTPEGKELLELVLAEEA